MRIEKDKMEGDLMNLNCDKKEIKISDSVDILKMINKYGVIEKRKLHLFFGKGKSPYVFNRRLSKMKLHSLINMNKRYCWIAAKGERVLDENGIEKNYASVYAKRIKLAKEANLLTMFPNRFILSRIEYLKNFETMEDISYARMFAGVVWNKENFKELVYLINDSMLKTIDNYVNLDTKVVGIKDVILSVDNINQLINVKEKSIYMKVKSATVIPRSEEGILMYDLFKKGYLNNRYVYKFLKESSSEMEIKLEDENLFINGMKTENFLNFDLKNIYRKTEKIIMNNTKNIVFIHFNFYDGIFTENTPFFTPTKIEFYNALVDIYDYIEFLESEYGYNRCSFKSAGAKVPYSDLFQ